MIHNGQSRELVITQPDHLKDFYKNDTQRKKSCTSVSTTTNLVIRSPKASQSQYGRIFWEVSLPRYEMLDLFSLICYLWRILGHAVGVQAGERWKIIRKYFDPEFAFKVTVAAMPRTLDLVNQWADQLVQHAAPSSKPAAGKSFTTDVQSVGKFLPFKIVSQQLYGQVFNEEVSSQL